jgi:hypothetical protein
MEASSAMSLCLISYALIHEGISSPFLISELGAGQRTASHPWRYTPDTHWIWSVGPTAGMGAVTNSVAYVLLLSCNFKNIDKSQQELQKERRTFYYFKVPTFNIEVICNNLNNSHEY